MGIKLMKNSVNVHLLVIEVALNNFLKSRREEEDENLFSFPFIHIPTYIFDFRREDLQWKTNSVILFQFDENFLLFNYGFLVILLVQTSLLSMEFLSFSVDKKKLFFVLFRKNSQHESKREKWMKRKNLEHFFRSLNILLKFYWFQTRSFGGEFLLCIFEEFFWEFIIEFCLKMKGDSISTFFKLESIFFLSSRTKIGGKTSIWLNWKQTNFPTLFSSTKKTKIVYLPLHHVF